MTREPPPRSSLPAELDDELTELTDLDGHLGERPTHNASTAPVGEAPLDAPYDTPLPVAGPAVPSASGFADDTEEHDIPPGTMVGEYRVENRLGSGGMGVVFGAVHPVIGKRVAIKVLKTALCANKVAVERFIDEARIVNQIEHPNIVDIFAFGQLADGRNYFVMELLRGESLAQRTATARLPIADACEILATLARALRAVHELGIVHRDLKPDNVFLVDVRGEAPQLKLLDFGIAKLVQDDQRPKRVEHTATGTIVGTPQYLSPEQAKGHAVDHRADIYALGGIAFELFTGRPPFVADNVMEVVAKHLMEAAPRPSAFVPSVPDVLDELVLAMLAKDPAARPALDDVIAALDDMQGSPDIAEAPPRVARAHVAVTPVATLHMPLPIRTPLPASRTPRPPAASVIVSAAAAAASHDDSDRTVPIAKGSPRRALIGVTVLALAATAGVLGFAASRQHSERATPTRHRAELSTTTTATTAAPTATTTTATTTATQTPTAPVAQTPTTPIAQTPTAPTTPTTATTTTTPSPPIIATTTPAIDPVVAPTTPKPVPHKPLPLARDGTTAPHDPPAHPPTATTTSPSPAGDDDKDLLAPGSLPTAPHRANQAPTP